MNEEGANQRKEEEEDVMTASVAVDKKEEEEPASQVSRRDQEEEGKCPQGPDQEGGQRPERVEINQNPEELNDSSSGSQVDAKLCNSHEDPERQRQIEEEKRIVTLLAFGSGWGTVGWTYPRNYHLQGLGQFLVPRG